MIKINLFAIIASAFVGAVIGQLVALFFQSRKKDKHLKIIKQIIESDMANVLAVTAKMSDDLNVLLQKFENDDLQKISTDAYQNLRCDVYESLDKKDLFSIYERKIHVMVDFYGAVEFLKKMMPMEIFESYKRDIMYLEDRKDKTSGTLRVARHRSREIHMQQIRNNLKTIRELKDDYEEIVKVN